MWHESMDADAHDLFVDLLQPWPAEALGRLVTWSEVLGFDGRQRAAARQWLRGLAETPTFLIVKEMVDGGEQDPQRSNKAHSGLCESQAAGHVSKAGGGEADGQPRFVGSDADIPGRLRSPAKGEQGRVRDAHGDVAQLGERLPCKQDGGSRPSLWGRSSTDGSALPRATRAEDAGSTPVGSTTEPQVTTASRIQSDGPQRAKQITAQDNGTPEDPLADMEEIAERLGRIIDQGLPMSVSKVRKRLGLNVVAPRPRGRRSRQNRSTRPRGAKRLRHRLEGVKFEPIYKGQTITMGPVRG